MLWSEVSIKSASGIYRITNTITHRFYIGSAVNLSRRWIRHKNELKNKQHKNPILSRSWEKYGEEAHEIEVLELVPNKQDLIPREQYWIDTLGAANTDILGMNCRPTAGSALGSKRSEEAKEKTAAKLRGKKRTPAQIERLRSVARPPSRKMIEAARVANTGRKQSEDLIRRRTAHQKGRQVSEEERARLVAMSRNRGVTSEETRRKMSEAHKTRLYNRDLGVICPACGEKRAIKKSGKNKSDKRQCYMCKTCGRHFAEPK